MKKSIWIVILILAVGGAALYLQMTPQNNGGVGNENGAKEETGNAVEKSNLVRLTTPQPNDVVKSPLTIQGEARGTWYFEASFPITLTDDDGMVLAEWYAMAEGEWMTEEFVPFTGTLTFGNPEGKKSGRLILKKDNPSGLPENADEMWIPVRF